MTDYNAKVTTRLISRIGSNNGNVRYSFSGHLHETGLDEVQVNLFGARTRLNPLWFPGIKRA